MCVSLCVRLKLEDSSCCCMCCLASCCVTDFFLQPFVLQLPSNLPLLFLCLSIFPSPLFLLNLFFIYFPNGCFLTACSVTSVYFGRDSTDTPLGNDVPPAPTIPERTHLQLCVGLCTVCIFKNVFVGWSWCLQVQIICLEKKLAKTDFPWKLSFSVCTRFYLLSVISVQVSYSFHG